jgi:hypothetical protein
LEGIFEARPRGSERGSYGSDNEYKRSDLAKQFKETQIRSEPQGAVQRDRETTLEYTRFQSFRFPCQDAEHLNSRSLSEHVMLHIVSQGSLRLDECLIFQAGAPINVPKKFKLKLSLPDKIEKIP